MSATKLSSHSTDQLAFHGAESVLINLDAVMIERGGRMLFQNINFSLVRGDVVHITGANGTGKTSLLRAIAGALPLAGGRLLRSTDEPPAFLPADDALWHGHVSVRAALSDWAAVLAVPTPHVDAALARVGLLDLSLRPLSMLSMGQKRRLSWARLLLRPASLWLLDEPFNSLDREGVASIAVLMRAHAASGGGIVVACHDPLETVLSDCRVIAVSLDRGDQ